MTYYSEKIIDGVLCHQNDPHGEWEEFTVAQLSERVERAELRVRDLEKTLVEYMIERNNASYGAYGT